MSLAVLFHFSCAQNISHINISIIRSLRLCCWITTLVVLFLVRCVLEIRCGWVGVVSVLQAEASAQPATRIPLQPNQAEASACNTDTTPTQPHRNSNTQRNKNNTTNVVIQQNSRKLLMMDILLCETCWAHEKWNKIASDIKLVSYSLTITMMPRPINIRCIRLPLKCDVTRAETSFRLSAKRTSPFKSAGGVSSVDYWQPRCAHQR